MLSHTVENVLAMPPNSNTIKLVLYCPKSVPYTIFKTGIARKTPKRKMKVHVPNKTLKRLFLYVTKCDIFFSSKKTASCVTIGLRNTIIRFMAKIGVNKILKSR